MVKPHIKFKFCKSVVPSLEQENRAYIDLRIGLPRLNRLQKLRVRVSDVLSQLIKKY